MSAGGGPVCEICGPAVHTCMLNIESAPWQEKKRVDNTARSCVLAKIPKSALVDRICCRRSWSHFCGIKGALLHLLRLWVEVVWIQSCTLESNSLILCVSPSLHSAPTLYHPHLHHSSASRSHGESSKSRCDVIRSPFCSSTQHKNGSEHNYVMKASPLHQAQSTAGAQQPNIRAPFSG